MTQNPVIDETQNPENLATDQQSFLNDPEPLSPVKEIPEFEPEMPVQDPEISVNIRSRQTKMTDYRVF